MRSKVLASGAVALVLAGSAAGASGIRPTLQLETGHAVHGRHFRSHELVRIVFVADGRRIRRVHASAWGSFTTPLPASFTACSGLLVRAAGTSGDVAVLNVAQRQCASPGTSGSRTGQAGGATQTSAAGSGTGGGTETTAGSGSSRGSGTTSGSGSSGGPGSTAADVVLPQSPGPASIHR
jgi:hypothetical protein